ncbi:DNA alkylation repair protein [Sphingomonas sp.]|uniref:DNA alkylation repair protein n=1 Tax=Sphingomonas sp. TaxID=28214 RepID=UPI002ED8294D
MTARAAAVLAALEAEGSAKVRDAMGPRYGIVTADRVFGVPMARIQAIARPLGKDHDLAAAMWGTRVYEGRMIAFLIDDPARVTHAQMDAWRAGFDNWAVTDTACFKLFDKVDGAAAMVEPWTRLNDEMGRRAGFALLACLALHGKPADYPRGLALIEGAASDERNFVKKGANWALRAIGGKKDPALRAAARELAAKLAASDDRTARWNGKDALRAFAKADGKGTAR